jgi:hypothetical protein
MILESGELNSRASLLIRSDRRLPSGSPDRLTWLTLVEPLWGKLANVGVRNLDIAKGFDPNVAYTFLCRFTQAATNDCKLTIRGNDYYVSGVVHDPSPERWWTQLYLTTVAA